VKELKNLEILNIVVLPSATIRGSFKNTYKVLTEYIKPIGSVDRISVIVIESKQYENHKLLINKCKNTKEYEDLKVPYIYYDGQRKTGNKNLQMEINIDINVDDRIRVSTESNEEHIVLCLSSLKVSDLAQAEAMSNYFKVLIDQNNQKMRKASESIRMSEQRLIEYKSQIDFIRVDITTSTKQLSEDKNQYENFVLNFNSSKDSFLNKINDEYKKSKDTLDEDTFKSTCDLCEILSNHGIEIEIFKKIFVIKDRFQTVLNSELMNNRKLTTLNTEIQSLLDVNF